MKFIYVIIFIFFFNFSLVYSQIESDNLGAELYINSNEIDDRFVNLDLSKNNILNIGNLNFEFIKLGESHLLKVHNNKNIYKTYLLPTLRENQTFSYSQENSFSVRVILKNVSSYLNSNDSKINNKNNINSQFNSLYGNLNSNTNLNFEDTDNIFSYDFDYLNENDIMENGRLKTIVKFNDLAYSTLNEEITNPSSNTSIDKFYRNQTINFSKEV
ncbi:MAG: hypothetical protein KC589_04210, partial [Nanoarchaeota archaeon]|nr:hypothetical protein [Nanoarchaeota archaeon]